MSPKWTQEQVELIMKKNRVINTLKIEDVQKEVLHGVIQETRCSCKQGHLKPGSEKTKNIFSRCIIFQHKLLFSNVKENWFGSGHSWPTLKSGEDNLKSQQFWTEQQKSFLIDSTKRA
jgi:hypothetical protein